MCETVIQRPVDCTRVTHNLQKRIKLLPFASKMSYAFFKFLNQFNVIFVTLRVMRICIILSDLIYICWLLRYVGYSLAASCAGYLYLAAYLSVQNTTNADPSYSSVIVDWNFRAAPISVRHQSGSATAQVRRWTVRHRSSPWGAHRPLRRLHCTSVDAINHTTRPLSDDITK